MTTKEFTGDVDLQAQLERFYQDGQLAQAAVVAWMLSALKPDSPDWKIYRKKLLRETGAEGASVTEIVSASDQAFDSQQPSDGFAALALGLLARPENSPLLKKMLDRARAFEQRNFITAALIQLKEEQTDPEVLNVLGAMAQEAERYEEAERFFSQLRKLRAESVEVRLNWTAALTGLKRYQEAIDELEWIIANAPQKKEALFRLIPLYRLAGKSISSELRRLDSSYFSAPASAKEAELKALIMQTLDEPGNAVSAYEMALGFGEDPTLRLDLSHVQLRLADYASGFKNYEARFDAIENMNWLMPSAARWHGENIGSASLLIWGEQGVGDEIFFGLMLEPVKSLCSNVTLAVDHRLMTSFAASFPEWTIMSRDDALLLRQQGALEFDYEISMGRLMPLFYEQQLAQRPPYLPLFSPSPARQAQIEHLLGDQHRPTVAISWAGGTDVDGKTRSMTLADMLAGLPADAAIDVISVQYTGAADREAQDYPDFRVRASGLNNREDLEGVLTLLSRVNAVISVDNSVAHLAEAVGTPSYILIPAALAQFRLKNEAFRRRYFPNATVLTRTEGQSWGELAAEAWSSILEPCK